jgi:hypothetical protein
MYPKVKDYNDKLIACIIGEDVATPAMIDQIEKIDFAWSMLHSGRSRHVVAQALENKKGLSKSQAYKIIRDSINLYGDINVVSLKGSKALHAENFKRIGRKAEESGDLRSAIAAYAKAAKIESAFETQQAQVQDPNAWLPAPVIEFTSNPEVFIASQKIPETDFEEVKPPAK